MPKLVLYCEKHGKCALKQVGVEPTLHFTDILLAISHVRALRADPPSTLTVYDAKGNLAFTDLL